MGGIKGDDGWVIIDPLTTSFTAKACLDLANATLGERPVTAVIYTHSHVDHYGGILGVTSADEVAKGNVRVLAPEGFMREAVAENLIATGFLRMGPWEQTGMSVFKETRGQWLRARISAAQNGA